MFSRSDYQFLLCVVYDCICLPDIWQQGVLPYLCVGDVHSADVKWSGASLLASFAFPSM